ncbi:hypothetical protein AK812_SmicGene32596 [Symbiodinium microadriaticum]|uniref:Uncharacterized protein n=1 Tax=Symbiodinium microadriaticum TaxID=2951 RepID=A0A1Q9CTR3_SYMMI|nr:hypothetical protein AK812_SmicGene32596 [Symbiodinium microadriaticum]CAE7940953.1 unnamed protein product [Symbiodinium sp. KB8]
MLNNANWWLKKKSGWRGTAAPVSWEGAVAGPDSSNGRVAPQILVKPEWRNTPRVIVNQDASPVVSVVAIAAEARHSEITGQLSMEHQGEAKFNDTEYAKHNALIEASMHASNAMRATEEINAQRDHIREVETSARRADEARSREVAS